MKLEVGEKVKLEHKGIASSGSVQKNSKARIGIIESIREYFIIIQFMNYKESIIKADITAPRDWELYVRRGNEWIKTCKEMLE